MQRLGDLSTLPANTQLVVGCRWNRLYSKTIANHSKILAASFLDFKPLRRYKWRMHANALRRPLETTTEPALDDVVAKGECRGPERWCKDTDRIASAEQRSSGSLDGVERDRPTQPLAKAGEGACVADSS